MTDFNIYDGLIVTAATIFVIFMGASIANNATESNKAITYRPEIIDATGRGIKSKRRKHRKNASKKRR